MNYSKEISCSTPFVLQVYFLSHGTIDEVESWGWHEQTMS